MRCENDLTSRAYQANRVRSRLSIYKFLARNRSGVARGFLVGCLCLCAFVVPLSAEEYPTYHAFGNENLDKEGRLAVWAYQGEVVQKLRSLRGSADLAAYDLDNARLDWEAAYKELEDLWRCMKDMKVRRLLGPAILEGWRSRDIRKVAAVVFATGTIEILEKLEMSWEAFELIEELELLQNEIEILEDVITLIETNAWEPILERRGLI